jgi:RimJ/RimL family protein N-acetyltransferase
MELTTSRLYLREMRLEDAEAANEYESDPEVARYQTHGVRSLEESRKYIAEGLVTAACDPRRTYDLAITVRAEKSDRLIGRAGLSFSNVELQEAMIWYVVRPADHGKGYATEAARAMLGFGFEVLKLHRIFADVDPLNIPSSRVCEKLGMRKEAHFIDNIFIKNIWCGTAIYALLDREWIAKH